MSAAWANAADPNVEALLAKMRAAYGSAKSVTFTTETEIGKQKVESSFSFLSPGKIRLALSSSTSKTAGVLLTRISDGKTVSSKAGKRAGFKDQPYTPDSFVAGVPVNLESICFFDWAKQLSTAPGKNMEHSSFKLLLNQDWRGKKWTVLEETATAQKIVCHYFIDPKTNFIWRTTVKAMPGGNAQNNADFQISQMNLAAKIDPSIFKIVRL